MMINIGIVVPSLRNLGPIIVMENLTKTIPKDKFNIVYISLRNNIEEDKNRFSEFRIFELGMGKFPTKKTYKKISEIIRNQKINVIHSNSFWPTYIISKFKNVKKITTVHNDPYVDFKYEYGFFIGYTMAKIFHRKLRKYDKVVCISKYVENVINLKNTITIYNSVDDDCYEKFNDNFNFIDENDFNIYTTSVLNKRKNISRMLDIIYDLKERKNSIKLYIIGDGSERKSIEEKIERLGLHDNVFLLGKKDRKYINNFSKKCDCFLFTSLSEGFGLSLVEAMRDFKYVACSNIPVAHELITKDIDGKICNSNLDFVEYIEKLVKDKRKLGKILISSNNHNHYEKNYTNDIFSKKYCNLYLDVMKKSVLYYVPFYDVGGIESLINELINQTFSKYNYSILVEKKLNHYQRTFLDSKNVTIYEIPDLKKVNFIKYIKCINQVFKNNHFDIFHSHDYTLRFLSMIFSKIYNIKLRICHIHTSSFEGKRFIKVKQKLARINLYFANKVITCSNEAYNFVNYKNSLIIYNGICSEKYKYDVQSRIEMRRKYKISSNEKVIIQVGRMVQVKNIFFTLEVISKLPGNYKLFLLGDGILKSQIEEKIKELEILNRVILTGNVSNVSDYYNASDYFVLPSYFEGLPITALEANCNGLISLISNNVTKEINCLSNLYYLDLSVDKWVNKIIECNINKQRELNFVEFKNSKFDFENFVKEVQEIYDK